MDAGDQGVLNLLFIKRYVILYHPTQENVFWR